MTEFTVLGRPRTKGSTVSFANERGRIVTKTDSLGLQEWTRDVGWAAKAAHVPLAPRHEPVRLHVYFHFAAVSSRACPTVRPDVDKILRALLDALTGIAYEDDAQVVEVFALKVYADDARTIVAVGVIPEENRR